jgi:inorganic pyrophosphatase
MPAAALPNFAGVLPPFAEAGPLHVFIDTPKGSRNKYKWDEKTRLWMPGGVLPAGAVLPFGFGFVPSTHSGDGDPLDVLVLMDEPAFVGCLIEARLLGVIEAEQTENGKTERNDRLIAVTEISRNHKGIESLGDLHPNLLHEIEHFFVSYNAAKGKEFRLLGREDAAAGRAMVRRAAKRMR